MGQYRGGPTALASTADKAGVRVPRSRGSRMTPGFIVAAAPSDGRRQNQRPGSGDMGGRASPQPMRPESR